MPIDLWCFLVSLVCLDAKIGRESVKKVGESKIPGILKIKEREGG